MRMPAHLSEGTYMPADRTMHFLWGGHLRLLVTMWRKFTTPPVFHGKETSLVKNMSTPRLFCGGR